MPIIPPTSSGVRRAVLDPADGSVRAFVTAGDVMGATPDGCVALLRIRPLLFGAAWKIADLFLEEAVTLAGETPDQRRGFSIERKRALARAQVGTPAFLPADIWKATALTYDGTALLRNSLVHQLVYVDSSDSLVGHDSNGGKLRPLTADEQEAFVHLALRLVEAAHQQQIDPRTDGDLRAQLARLKGIHKESLAGAVKLVPVPELTVVLDLGPDGSSYLLDVPDVRSRSPFKGDQYCDLVLQFRDRPGLILQPHLGVVASAFVVGAAGSGLAASAEA